MPLPATASHRGILHPAATPFTLSRHRPAPDLAVFVERHWIVRWDLRGRAPFRQETLPHPCVNIVIERDRARVYGVETASQHYFNKSAKDLSIVEAATIAGEAGLVVVIDRCTAIELRRFGGPTGAC